MNSSSHVLRPMRSRPLALPLRLMTYGVVISQLLTPCNWQVMLAVNSLLANGSPGARSEGTKSRPALEETPTSKIEALKSLASIERTEPITQPSTRPVFSDPPTDAEIFGAAVFEEPLVPIGKQTTPEENRALARAMVAFLDRSTRDDFSSILDFLEEFPQSPWRPALLTNLGLCYRHTGYFTLALAVWEEAWAVSKSETNRQTKVLADRAVGELLDLQARLGRYDRLEKLFQELGDREIVGSPGVKAGGARQGLWAMNQRPEESFLCGPYAVQCLWRLMRPGDTNRVDSEKCRSTRQGTSLAQITDLAKDYGLELQPAKRNPGSKLILPAVVNWKAGHFAALVRERDGLLLVQDSTFGDDLWISRRALDQEGSGYFLVAAGPLPAGWQAISRSEAEGVWGKGTTTASDPSRTRPGDPKVGGDGCPGNGFSGMASYAVHSMLVSLNIVDTPVGYTPPLGPGVYFKATYNQKEASQSGNFNFSNLGNQWTFDWISYVIDDTGMPSADVKVFLQGGGTEPYRYNTNTSGFDMQFDSRTRLVRTSTNSYERQLPDGSKQVFNVTQVSGATRRVYLTQDIDPFNNILTYQYEAVTNGLRLARVIDAINQTNTIAYELGGDAFKITKVTDPFSRYATFAYDGSARITNITDVIGIQSQFTYSGGADSYINSLTTPYGTTTFSYGTYSGLSDGRERKHWLEATDPLGQKERVEFQDTGTVQLDWYPGEAPSHWHGGFNHMYGLAPQWFRYRNTFYWDKKAMQLYPDDVFQARIYHWCHWGLRGQYGSQTSGTLEFEKDPLATNRLYYMYPGQPDFDTPWEGTNGLPSAIGRVLDDGSNQVVRFAYNDFGRVTMAADQYLRSNLFVYATNQIDLLEVRQTTGGTNTEMLAKFTYNSQHLPLTAIDASGKTNSLGYNSYGQLTAVTNALNQITAFKYDSKGYLTNITGAIAGAKTDFTYDATNRVRTITDSDGYRVTFDYDNADRVTKITYPDNSFDQIVYDKLDPVLLKDRRGHWTMSTCDALRRVTDVFDALGRNTHLEWCSCGSLESITDPLQRTTRWLRDLQGRVTSKIYPDTTQWNYLYETNTSRLKQVTDARNQRALYAYNLDNTLRQVTYTNTTVSTAPVSFTYDTNYNRLKTMVDTNGTTTYSYFAVTNTQLGAGGLQSIDGPWSNDTISYTYDELGRVSTRTIDTKAVKLTYDALGRVSSVTNVLGTFTNNYVGATFRIATNTMPNGQFTTFSYFPTNEDLRLQTVHHKKSGGSTLSKFDYTYDLDGQIATWTQQADANSPTVWVTDYDPADQLAGVTVRTNSVTGAILKQFFYSYDKAGNRDGEAIHVPGIASTVTSAGFNNVNQLISVALGGTTRFRGSMNEIGTVKVAGANAPLDSRNTNFVGYAEAGVGTNVVNVIATDYSANNRTNKYQLVVTNGATARTLAYDLNGNLISNITAIVTTTYEWDGTDRLVAINSGIYRSEFTYDGLGRRTQIIEKQNGTLVSTKKYLWCGVELCEERDSSGGTVQKRFLGQGEEISGTKHFFTRDHLGSIRELTDNSGNVVSRYEYDPYGRRKKVSGGTDADFAFTGHYFHAVSGLHLTLYRAYDAETGRWLSRDPIEEAGGLNLYAYCVNDPLNCVDPFGLQGTGPRAVQPRPPPDPLLNRIQLEIQLRGIADPARMIDRATRARMAEETLDKGIPGRATSISAPCPPRPGRRGNELTRDQLDRLRDDFLRRYPEYRHTAGGRAVETGKPLPEEYIPGPGGGRKGSSYPDLTFQGPNFTVRLNTVDTVRSGAMTQRELDNFVRIMQQTREPVIVVPKSK